MHVLFVADDQLFPTTSGGRLAARNDLAALWASGFQTTSLVMHRGTLDPPTLSAHRDALGRVLFVRQRGVLTSNLTHPRLPAVCSMRIPTPHDYRRVSCALEELPAFDVVIASHEYTLGFAKSLARVNGARVVLRSHNDECRYLRELARTAKTLKSRLFFGADAWRMDSCLDGLLSGVDCVALISSDDAEIYAMHGARTIYVPPVLSSDVRRRREIPGFAGRLPRMVFVGALDVPTTADGLVWFTRTVLPLIRSHDPHVDLEVIGRGLSDTLRRTLSVQPGVVITGEVRELDPHLDRARLFVNPVFRGSGVSMKLGPPAAAGLPILSTHFGMRGLSTLRGPIVACDEPSGLAQAALELLSDENRWLEHSSQLLAAVESSHSIHAAAREWRSVATA